MLLAEGHQVVGVDNLNEYYDVRLKDYRLGRLLSRELGNAGNSSSRSEFHENRRYVHGNFVFVRLDIVAAKAVKKLFDHWEFDAVINLAARAGVRYSIDHPEIYIETNVMGSLNLLQAMAFAGVKKYVLASSSSVYAGESPPFKEDVQVSRPISPYASSKMSAESMAYAYHYLHGMDVSVLRYFTVYGPAGRPDMSPFRFIKWIDEGVAIQMYGDGKQSRDFTFVDDIAAGTISALRPLGYEVINLGGGNCPLPMIQLIKLLEVALGKKAVVQFQPGHQGDMRSTQADINKAKAMLSWEPETEPASGLAKTVEWYKQNLDWLRKIEV